jgi:hypothetical protein
MKANVRESAAVSAPQAGSVKLPSGLMSRRPLSAAHRAGFVLYLEAFGLGCLITAVAGVLPLVMLLHR